ncbi:MAG: GTPase, partial [Parachlamydiales bacterium]
VKTSQKELLALLAVLEAQVDFPEEDLEESSLADLEKKLFLILEKIQALAASFENGLLVQSGIRLTILGAPNVGKSSLFNALCQKDRAIVNRQPGTTRDILEEKIQLGGLLFHLCDTAGIRQTRSSVEKEGIRRAKEKSRSSDLNLLVLDASRPLQTTELKLIEQAQRLTTILIWNKTDLNPQPPTIGFPFELRLSLKPKKENGYPPIEELKETLKKIALKTPLRQEELLLTSERHQKALLEAWENGQKALAGLKQKLSAELIAEDLRFALLSLGRIIGQDLSEDLLSEIFSKFCVGK